MRDKSYWWAEAKKAGAIVGWFPTVILAQWQVETGNFSSSNFVNNNNIAGQTWREYMPEFMKGTARPTAEGGYYIKYDDAVDGYVDFIKKNPRYSNVCTMKTEEAQIREIAARGWAVDPMYADTLTKNLYINRDQGYVLEVEPVLDKGVAKTIVNTWMKPSYEESKTDEQKNYIRWLANQLRLAAGMKEDEDFE